MAAPLHETVLGFQHQMLASLKEEYMRPKVVGDYKFIKSSGKPDGLSPKMGPALRDRESEILKDSGQVRILGRSRGEE